MADHRFEFTFHQCLGKGGFGEVYLATVSRPGGLSRRMAVKILREGLDNLDDAVNRLRDEGRMLTILNHPRILRAEELCRIEGRIALITEYVEGADLSRFTKGANLLPKRVALQVVAHVADALYAAWSTPSPDTGRPLHLVHRDVKPENVRLTNNGEVKLLDFGIARSTEMIRDAQTRIGDVPFTVGYAAPEAFRTGEQGPASDIYALGATAYRILQGEKLFEGMDLEQQFELACMPKQYPAFVDERLRILQAPERVADLIRRMLAYAHDERPTARTVRDSCEDLADEVGGPTLARWARGEIFPAPKNVKNATFTGRTVREDVEVTREPPPSSRALSKPQSAERVQSEPTPSGPLAATPQPIARRGSTAESTSRATPAPAPPMPLVGRTATPSAAAGRTARPGPKREESPAKVQIGAMPAGGADAAMFTPPGRERKRAKVRSNKLPMLLLGFATGLVAVVVAAVVFILVWW